MTSLFGFSASDFVAAIDLTIKIAKALRTSGGAATDRSSHYRTFKAYSRSCKYFRLYA